MIITSNESLLQHVCGRCDPHSRALLNVPVILGGPLKTTWGAFVAVNEGAVDFAAILALWAKRPTATYHGGGGAEAEWSIRLDFDR